MKTRLLIHRFVRRQRTALLAVSLAVLCIGCKHATTDSLGVPISEIDQIYTRTGTNIRIDILHYAGDSGPGADFTTEQKAQIVKALESLTDQQLIQSHVYKIVPEGSNFPSGVRIAAPLGASNNYIMFINVSPSDPNLENEILTAMGFPPAATAASSTKAPTSPSANIVPASGGPTTVTPLDAQGSQAISSQSPSTYVPIKSKEGMQAVMSDYSLGQSKDPNKQPTFQDQVRPHGDVSIVTPDK